jgi:hypothetical protein
MNPRPIQVTPKADYTLEITFSNKEVRLFDMKPYLEFGIFKELKDKFYFNQAKIEDLTVRWPHGRTSALIHFTKTAKNWDRKAICLFRFYFIK